MAKFETQVMRVESVDHHPNADRLSVMKIRNFNVISAKLEDGSHRYSEGDLVVYVQEGSVVPEYLLRKGFWDESKNRGILAGTLGNRVKPIKLRNILSEGIMFPLENGGVFNATGEFMPVAEGTDVSSFLGIVKWEPEIPVGMSGDLVNIGAEHIVKYDIENLKKWPDVLEDVTAFVTEKLHGTFTGVGHIPGLDHEGVFGGEYIIFSKGLGSKGLVFKDTEENREKNLYVRMALKEKLFEDLDKIRAYTCETGPIFMFGETFGRGVQDLHYGCQRPKFRVFDIFLGTPKSGRFMNADRKYSVMSYLNILPVPVLGRFGPEELQDKIVELTSGQTTFDGHNVREGVVITPVTEMSHPELGRVILKSVSEEYLTRKGSTTEFQ